MGPICALTRFSCRGLQAFLLFGSGYLTIRRLHTAHRTFRIAVSFRGPLIKNNEISSGSFSLSQASLNYGEGGHLRGLHNMQPEGGVQR
ncbi:hypothetical protein BJ322DRAFT_1052388 [Thelephora terrestris]|uniref:Uncharacterized protein n=1 Tax=Thelephora terrestris TaxID=56493 RepID=A0A9P6L877_9AGAM|nr:hypothetical protein BJ322DRAFT_1052388 [Thelephora terrestris]